jgi:hypothetical protein
MNQEEALRRIAELEAENERLTEALRKAQDKIANAKDISPVKRVTQRRVVQMAASAGLDVIRHKVKGWIVSMGNRSQWYDNLRDIWDKLKREDWKLSEIIPSIISPKDFLFEQIGKIDPFKETELSEIDSIKEESVCPNIRAFNHLRIPPVVKKPERHPTRAEYFRSRNQITPRLPIRHPSLVPVPF